MAGAQEPPDALCLGRPLFTGVAPHIEGHRSVKLDMRRWHGHPEQGRAPWRIEQTEEERVSGRHLPRRRGPPEGVPELKHVEHIQGEDGRELCQTAGIRWLFWGEGDRGSAPGAL